MAALGAYFSPVPSATYNRQKIKLQPDGIYSGEYRVSLSSRAFKQEIEQQNLTEREFFNSRCRANLRRKRQENLDPYKRRAKQIEPFGILVTCVGILACCCGYIVEWARTFPLGDVTPWMPWIQVGGLVTTAIGILLLTISHLLYYKTDTVQQITSSVCDESNKVYQLTNVLHGDGKSIKRGKWISNCIFYIASSMLVCSCLAFFIGYINGWASQLPVKIGRIDRRIAATLGISGLVLSVLLLWTADIISTWMTSHVERRISLEQNTYIDMSAQPNMTANPQIQVIRATVPNDDTRESQLIDNIKTFVGNEDHFCKLETLTNDNDDKNVSADI